MNNRIVLGIVCISLGSGISVLPTLVHAVDGVILIDQNRVIAAGGFPYRITQPGSYRLAGNLTVGNADGILIDTPYVTLDLNGFSISSGTGFGILSTTRGGSLYATNVTVYNGTVHDMGSTAIALGDRCRIENVKVHAASATGIAGGHGCQILNNTVTGTRATALGGGFGIYASSESTISGNVVTGNDGPGVAIAGPEVPHSNGTLVTNNVVSNNKGIGLDLNVQLVGYSGNTITYNKHPQVTVISGRQIGGNICAPNSAAGGFTVCPAE